MRFHESNEWTKNTHRYVGLAAPGLLPGTIESEVVQRRHTDTHVLCHVAVHNLILISLCVTGVVNFLLISTSIGREGVLWGCSTA